MRRIVYKTSFKKDVLLMQKRGRSLKKLEELITILQADLPIPQKHRDHQLSGNYSGFRDCHIEPDWLLIYKKDGSEDEHGLLRLEATGTHSDLF
jgi:mRNA interferase YafQ